MKRLISILAIMVLAFCLYQPAAAADKYTVIGGVWDIDMGQYGAGVDWWQDLGFNRFFVGEHGYVSEAKSDDPNAGLGVGPGYWIFNNDKFQVGVMVQGASAFVASKDGETDTKWGGQLVGAASYVLPEKYPAHAITLITRHSFIDDGETNILIGFSFKAD